MSVFPDSILSAVDWSGAPCTKVSPDLFFPDASGHALHAQVRAARSICETCPISSRQQCAKRALEGDDHYGIWAGVYVNARAGERRVALAELRKIAGPEAGERRRAQHRSRPQPCAGKCGRSVRPGRARAVDFPGTVSNQGGWQCRRCHDRANGIVRGVA